MSKKFKILSMLLAVSISVSIGVTGCGKKADPGASQTTTQSDKSEEVKPVKLTWYMRNSAPKNVDSVMAKANELISNKLKNTTLELKFINPGDYNDKMQMIMAASEEFDICFTSSWANNYLNAVSKGAYIPLDNLLAKYLDLKKSMSDVIWSGVKVNGKIYGVPNNQVMYSHQGFWFKKDLVEKYKFDLSKVKKYSDLTPIFQTIKDKEPDVIPLRNGSNLWFCDKYIPQVEGFAVNTEKWEAYDLVNDSQQLEILKTLREWNQKGFFPPDVATLKDEMPLIKAGKVFSRFSGIKPGAEAELKMSYGFEVVMLEASIRTMGSGSAISTVTSISATSKNQERAMALINLVNTDKEVYNTLVCGIEGQDYTKLSDNRVEKKPDSYNVPGWMVGSVFNTYLLPGQPDNVWELTQKYNNESPADPTNGFNFNRKNVENEIAQINAVRAEYDSILLNGLDDPEKILKLRNEKMKAAGVDKVIAEINKQLADWRKSK